MPRRPRLHRHKTGQWRARIHGRDKYYGTDYSKALGRFYHDLADSHPIDAEEATVVDAVLYYQGLKPDEVNRRTQLTPLLTFAGARYLAVLPKSFLADYSNWLKGAGYAPSTIELRVRLARAVLSTAHELGWLNGLPPLPKLDRAAPQYRDLPPSRIAELIGKVAKSRHPWCVNVLRFIAYTGARPGEACGLRWEWVDLDAGMCRVPLHKTRRHAKVRVIYLTQPAVDLLNSLGPRPSGWVFAGPRGQPASSACLSKVCRSRGFYPYQLRHSFAQVAREQGVALDELQVLLGHAKIETTQIYAQVRSSRAVAVAQRLTPPAVQPLGD